MAGEGAADRVRELLGLPVRHGVPSPPRVVLHLRGAVPGSVVRITAALLVAAVVGLSGAPTVVVVAGLVAAGLVLRWPQWPVAPVALVVVAFVLLAGPDLLAVGGAREGTGLLRLSALVLCGHLAVRLGALAARIAWRGVVDVAVLGVVARSVLGVQVVVQGSLLVVVWLRSGLGGVVAGQEWLRLLAAAAVVVVAVLVVPRAWLGQRRRRALDD
ncbi:hypothetical protein ICW40_11000 [Actinotalea ferrariae]|uniref:hypothetical protein n=1 Tax=Actinotalea ferrariae TaxID=1386098 RepID=UPI001C8C03F4|nr:hypothetical protein [Actinotalea ferrariae]MBX9245331.1 hypothetical protein [Actinotalea ferrariae]